MPPGVLAFNIQKAAKMGRGCAFVLDLRRLAYLPLTATWFPRLADTGGLEGVGVLGRAQSVAGPGECNRDRTGQVAGGDTQLRWTVVGVVTAAIAAKSTGCLVECLHRWLAYWFGIGVATFSDRPW